MRDVTGAERGQLPEEGEQASVVCCFLFEAEAPDR